MTTLEKWIVDHSLAYSSPHATPAVQLMDELKAVERLVGERDTLGSLDVIGSYESGHAVHDGLGFVEAARYDLPVVKIAMPKRGLRLCASDHPLFGWSITVEAELPVPGLDHAGMEFQNLTAPWFNGFQAAGAPIHGSYAQDQRRFSFLFRKLNGLEIAIERLIARL